MHDLGINLTPWLRLAAAAQLGIALLNLALPRIMRWRDDLNRMPLLIREVFHVHAWFVSITLGIFAVMTWRFAAEMTTNAACRWLAAAMGLFWALRTLLQVSYYSSSHWRGRPGRTVMHVTLLLIYGGFAAVYLWASFGK
jgi:hypothetical protein